MATWTVRAEERFARPRRVAKALGRILVAMLTLDRFCRPDAATLARALLLATVGATVGCTQPGASCVPGASALCACGTGSQGAQVCEAGGTFGPCVCATDRDSAADIDAASSDDTGPVPMDTGVQPVDGGALVDGGVEPMDAALEPDTAPLGDAGADAAPPADAGPPAFALRIPVDTARMIVNDSTGDLYPTAAFTIELWVSFDRLTAGYNQYLLIADGTMGNVALRLNGPINTFGCLVRNGLGGYLTSDVDVATSAFAIVGGMHHVACTGSAAGILTLWIDGIAVRTVSGVIHLPEAGSALGVGQSANVTPSPALRFNGLIDEVRISNTVLYVAPFTPARRLAVNSSTLALWHFDEGTGTSAADAVGSGSHVGTLDMGATWAPE